MAASLNAGASLPRPLVGLAISTAAGIAAGTLLPLRSPMFMAAAAVAATVFALLARGNGASSGLLHLAAALTASGHAWLSRPGRAPNELHHLLERPGQFMEVVVRVAGYPVRLSPGAESERSWFRFSAVPESVRVAEDRWRTAGGRIEVRMPVSAEVPPPQYGDRWHVGMVVRLGPDGRLGGVVHSRAVRLAPARTEGLLRRIYAQRERSRRALFHGVDGGSRAAGIAGALVLGYREDVPADVRELFLRTGTAHVFAISGLHVGIVGAVLAGLLRLAGVPRRWWAAAMVPLLALYTAATGASVSSMRAFTMAAAWWLAPIFRRRPDPPSALALAAVAILLAAPAQIAEPGFWFSFLVVAALLATGRTSAPTGEPGVGAPAAWRLAARVADLGRASLAAWCASTPLTVYLGNQVAPAAVVGNLVVIPASFLIVLTGCLSLLVHPIAPAVSAALNRANTSFAGGLIAVVEVLFDAPGSHWFVRAPPLWGIVLAYGAMAGWRVLEGRPRRTLAAAAAAVALAGATRYATDSATVIRLPPAALAPAILVDAPGERGDWLIDPGPAWRSDRLLRWLRTRGVDRLEAVVLTVLDADHAGAAEEVLRRVRTNRVLLPATSARSAPVRAMIDRWRNAGVPMESVAAGDAGYLRGGAEWRCFHPPPDASFRRTADGGLWLRLALGGSAVLLAGPATEIQRLYATRQPHGAAATVVVMDRAPAEDDAEWLVEWRPTTTVIRAPPPAWSGVRAVPSVAIFPENDWSLPLR